MTLDIVEALLVFLYLCCSKSSICAHSRNYFSNCVVVLSVVPGVILCVVLVTHRSDTIVEKRWPIRTIIIIIHHMFVNGGTKWICIFDHFISSCLTSGFLIFWGSD